ncbi:MAG: type I-C CRISPR-associated protein Cas5c [Tissierellia bacterium]|nr:type I-C CRISPR-associated protein Cas5c [Tissierellia bacterium]
MDVAFQSKPFYYKIWGDTALFTDPISKGGGEKFSYSVPTYQALKGITENLYWKPTLVIIIDEVKIMRPIRTQTNGIRTLIGTGPANSNDRSYYTYLVNVEYLVKFHFEWNENRSDLIKDRNEIKHQEIILRTLRKGGRRDVFLGTRECVGYVEIVTGNQYDQSKGWYHDETISFGIMFHSFDYPQENNDNSNQNLESRYAEILMQDSTIRFIRPEECRIRNILRRYAVKNKQYDKIKTVDEELSEM